MSLRNTAPERDGSHTPAAILSRAVELVRGHVHTWAERYVAMRIEARR